MLGTTESRAGGRINYKHGLLMLNKQWRAFLTLTLVTTCLGLTACGSGIAASGHQERYLRGQPHAIWAGKVGPRVARLKLPFGGSIVFLVVECQRNEPQCHQVGFFTESPFTREPGHAEPERRLNEGPRVNHLELGENESFNKVFDLPVIGYDCEGPYAIAPVDALLRQPRDTVIDRSGKEIVRMKKASIPARFHPKGVLVYGLLLPRANTVVVKAPDGHVVAREQELGADEEAHFKAPATPRNCAAQYRRLRGTAGG